MTIADISDERLRLLAQGATERAAIYKIKGETISAVYYSPDLPGIAGMSAESYALLVARDAISLVMPSDRDVVRSVFAAAAASGAPVNFTCRIDTKKRGITWVRVKANPCGEMDGSPLYLVAFENASNELDIYQLLLNHSNSMIYISDSKTYEMLYANKQARDYRSETDNSYLGRKCYEYIRGEQEPCDWCFLDKVKNRGHYDEERYITSRDCYQHISGELVNWCGREAFVQYVDDVTESRKLQKELEASQRMYKLAVEGARLGVWEYDIKGRRIIMADNSGLMSGFPRVIEDVPMSLLHFIEPQDRPKLLKTYEKIHDGAASVTVDLWVRMHPELPPRCERHVYTVVRDREGRPVRAYAISQDVTARKREDEKYRIELQTLLSAASDSLCMFRLNLTANLCSIGYGASAYIQKLVSSDTVDGLFSNVAGIIIDEREADEFRSIFSRKALLEQFARGEPRATFTYRRLSEGDEPLWTTTYVSMLQNPDSGDVEAVVYSVNIDRAKKEEEILAAVTDCEFDFIALVDAENGKLEYHSITEKARSARPCLTSDYEEAANLAARNCLDEAEPQAEFLSSVRLAAVIARLNGSGEYSVSATYREAGLARRKKFSYRWFGDSKRSILFTCTDVTEAFLQEREQADRIRKALLSAERANSLKSEFLSNVSHDLRTPMNAVLGYAGLALKADGAAAKDGYLDKIISAGQLMTSLINDTLDLSKIETGNVILKLEPVRNSDLMQKIMTTVMPWVEAKHISLHTGEHCDTDSTIVADPVRLYEIYVNLISNAVKFTPDGGHVEFLCDTVRSEEDHVWYRITIRDDGAGMSAGFQTKLFEPFAQERTEATAGIGGSGLGLSIVRRLVELMGGTIKVKSELGEGTEVVLELDFKRAGEAAPPAGEAAVGGLAGRKVLLCEDNAMNTEITVALLSMQGITAVCAADGRQGLEKFLDSAPGEFDAVLMDLRMPVMSGFEAAHAIRSSGHPDAASIPIIAMSADAYDEDVKMSMEAGMDSHIAKPIAPDRLFSELSRLCAKRGAAM